MKLNKIYVLFILKYLTLIFFKWTEGHLNEFTISEIMLLYVMNVNIY